MLCGVESSGPPGRMGSRWLCWKDRVAAVQQVHEMTPAAVLDRGQVCCLTVGCAAALCFQQMGVWIGAVVFARGWVGVRSCFCASTVLCINYLDALPSVWMSSGVCVGCYYPHQRTRLAAQLPH